MKSNSRATVDVVVSSDAARQAPVLPAPQGSNPVAPVARPLPGPDEMKLIAAAHRGDRAAFQTIVERHQGAVYGYLRSRLLEAADAEDLTQEVFLRSYVGHARFEGTVMIRPWLLGIAAQPAARARPKDQAPQGSRLDRALSAVGGRPDRIRSAHLRRRDGSFAGLPGFAGPNARQALDLRYQARLRLSEIGEKLHRSEGAVKLLMFRARQALKRCLDAKILGCDHD